MKMNEITACVVDHGAYLPLARKLAESYGRVLYYTPWEEAYPCVDKCCIGDGFDCIERCDDFWDEKSEIDAFIFPDILHGGLQEELRRQGYRVWGSGMASDVETDRMLFLRILQEAGLEMPKVTEVRGVSNLREELRDQEDKYIKIGRFRGTMETKHWRSWDEDKCWLDWIAVKLGPLADLTRFLVCEPIDTEIEIGGDTYCIDGQYPKHIMEGYEWKDKSVFGRLKPFAEAADCVREVLEAFAPVLGHYGYRNYFSAEIRVKDDGKFYFLDPCCRGPLPMSWSQCELYQNLAEIIWEGANGTLVEPEFDDTYSCECILSVTGDRRMWASIAVPDDLKDAMKISDCCKAGDVLAKPPDKEHLSADVGWLVSTGKTPRQALERQLDMASRLPEGISAATESLAGLMREIADAESKGMEFSPLQIPKPKETVAEA